MDGASTSPAGGGWGALPSPEESGWEGWCVHWLAAHSPPDLVELVIAERLSTRSHGRLLWRRLRVRINELEYRLAQEQTDGVTGRDLLARAREPIGELEEAQAAVRVLETIGPYLSERRPH